MTLNRGYKYFLDITSKQKSLLYSHIFSSNQAWNICVSLNEKQYKENKQRKLDNEELSYLSLKDIDDKVKEVLRGRELPFNTKVVQQTRKIFNDDLSKKFKGFDRLIKEHNKKQSEKKARNKNHKYKQFTLFNYKSSKDTKNFSFETTKEQYRLLDYINPVTGEVSKKYKVLRLFRNSFKIRWSRDLPKDYSTITISCKDDKFYISFNTKIIIEPKNNEYSKSFHSNNGEIKKLKTNEKITPVGMDINIDTIDFGNKKFMKSIKTKTKSNNVIDKNLNKIKRLKRKQSRRVEKYKTYKSNQTKILKKELKEEIISQEEYDTKISLIKMGSNFNKTQKRINKHFTKNTNIKLYYLHNLANEIIKSIKEKKANTLFLEDLDIKSMTNKNNVNETIGKKKTKSMKKNILQSSWGMFLQILKYKCAENEIYFNQIDPKNTTKQCSNCDYIKSKDEMNITIREYICENCNNKLPRDVNSVLNVLKKGIKSIS